MTLEQTLALALRKGDQKAVNKVYEKIYESYRGLLYFIATKFPIPPSSQDDLVSETFLAFFDSANKKEIKHIRPFLVTTMENRCKDFLRKPVMEEFEDTGAEDSVGLVVEELRSLLGEEDFALFYDYYVYELDSKELAKKRKATPSAIRQRLHRIKAKARRFMEE